MGLYEILNSLGRYVLALHDKLPSLIVVVHYPIVVSETDQDRRRHNHLQWLILCYFRQWVEGSDARLCGEREVVKYLVPFKFFPLKHSQRLLFGLLKRCLQVLPFRNNLQNSHWMILWDTPFLDDLFTLFDNDILNLSYLRLIEIELFPKHLLYVRPLQHLTYIPIFTLLPCHLPDYSIDNDFLFLFKGHVLRVVWVVFDCHILTLVLNCSSFDDSGVRFLKTECDDLLIH